MDNKLFVCTCISALNGPEQLLFRSRTRAAAQVQLWLEETAASDLYEELYGENIEDFSMGVSDSLHIQDDDFEWDIVVDLVEIRD